VKLAAVASLESFALLGPGFGGDGWTLLSGLRETSGPPELVSASFEALGSAPRRFVAERREAVTVEFEPPRTAPQVVLRAEGYHEAVARIREAIAAGDVYQVCYTVRAEVRIAGGSELLATMCRNGVPRFAAWVRLPDGEEFVSASPELFFETRGRRIHTEPMKGTARPGAAGALESSEKDRAELAMITDLLRNDLAQVCTPRSVRVECERRIMGLPYALQTVSDVVGELAEGASPLDALAVLHPGGSVTGAPKLAALAMIRDLESGPRGAYCGALGLCTQDGCTFSMLIRTARRTDAGWVYGVGGGIVYDSDAEKELEELEVKLGALRCGTRSCD
jgi:para-aminobenzoate synthetase/4-amino-4-deoxychorismate lyase